MPNCTPSLIASRSRHPRRRTATPVVSLRMLGRDRLLKDCPPSLFLPNMGNTWTPNCPPYFLPIPKVDSSRISGTAMDVVLGFVGKLARRPESEQFFRLAKTAKQAILVSSSMEPDAATRKKGRSKPDRVFRHSLATHPLCRIRTKGESRQHKSIRQMLLHFEALGTIKSR